MLEPDEARRLIGKLKPGDIILVSEKGLQHAINRFLQRSRWHHVMLYIGKGRTMEVTPRNGAHICDLTHDLTEKLYFAFKALRKKGLSTAQRQNIAMVAQKTFSGKKFSWGQYLKVVIGRALHSNKQGSHSLVCRPGHKCNTNSVACSNMVAMAYYEAGFPISENYMPEYVVPRDYEVARGFFVVIDKKLTPS